MPETQTARDKDHAYPHPDLVAGYITRRGVKTFHVRKPGTEGVTVCGRNLAELIDGGWARQLRRRGLDLCSKCAGLVDLDAPLETDEDAE